MPMKKYMIIAAAAWLSAACTAPSGMQVQVTPLGEEVEESRQKYFYALPRTVLKVELTIRESRQVPGPYMEYAERYLGISEVIRQDQSSWSIQDARISQHAELDPGMLYQIHLLEGDLEHEHLSSLLEKGVILDGTCLVSEEIKGPGLQSHVSRDYVHYEDLGIESNFEERTETMYKTIVTDTSFVQVPVDRTITEQKSPGMKASEAADFILELRTRRFELLTGEYDSYPSGVAMEATLKELDELEASYLSLFTGKTLGKTYTLSWFVVPEAGAETSAYSLAYFSTLLGPVPEDLMEGNPLSLRLEPMGTTGDVAAYYEADGGRGNELYYRLPDLARVRLLWGDQTLLEQRMSIFQAGAIITRPF